MNRHRSLLVYDGDCAFCTTWVRRLEAVLGKFPEAQPWQWLDLDELGLTGSDVASYVWLLSDGRRYRGHAAFGALLRMQPSRGLRFLGHLIATPPFSWVAGAGYFLIARFRHRLPGGTAACAMPKPVNRPR
ncbi:MAG: DCC1-like thiol-disulfide oxidoreductase family protein [Microlunatus sp.]